MAGKVPKFGAWEGGENYTVYFDNARKTKQNGPMTNPNDPQENPGLFSQKGAPSESQSNEKSGEPQGKVPQFGAWGNGDNVGYTMYFENARKTKNTTGGAPTVHKPEPKVKPGSQETRPTVPQFGAWGDEDQGEVAYTMSFDNVRKNKTGQPNVEELYMEPQFNREVGGPTNKARKDGHVRNPSRGSIGSTAESERLGRQTPVGQSPLHPRVGKMAQSKPGSLSGHNAEKVSTIPAFGVWKNDPAIAAGFTSTFARAREERLTPLHPNAPPSYNNQTQSKEKPKKGCWYACFG